MHVVESQFAAALQCLSDGASINADPQDGDKITVYHVDIIVACVKTIVCS
jgi:hypothetical protein